MTDPIPDFPNAIARLSPEVRLCKLDRGLGRSSFYISKADKYNPASEYYSYKYLSVNGEWEKLCSNGWFHTAEEAVSVFNKVSNLVTKTENLRFVDTEEELHWEEREQ